VPFLSSLIEKPDAYHKMQLHKQACRLKERTQMSPNHNDIQGSACPETILHLERDEPRFQPFGRNFVKL
jgi:hypothetical protein